MGIVTLLPSSKDSYKFSSKYIDQILLKRKQPIDLDLSKLSDLSVVHKAKFDSKRSSAIEPSHPETLFNIIKAK